MNAIHIATLEQKKEIMRKLKWFTESYMLDEIIEGLKEGKEQDENCYKEQMLIMIENLEAGRMVCKDDYISCYIGVYDVIAMYFSLAYFIIEIYDYCNEILSFQKEEDGNERCRVD